MLSSRRDVLFLFLGVVLWSPVYINAACPPSKGFTSFNGGPATQMADCAWDFFACARTNSDQCCQKRFQDCCHYIEDPAGFEAASSGQSQHTQPQPPLTPPETTTEAPYQHADTLIGCIWQFNNCLDSGRVPESKCNQRWDECKMIIMGMAPPPSPPQQSPPPPPFPPANGGAAAAAQAPAGHPSNAVPSPAGAAAAAAQASPPKQPPSGVAAGAVTNPTTLPIRSWIPYPNPTFGLQQQQRFAPYPGASSFGGAQQYYPGQPVYGFSAQQQQQPLYNVGPHQPYFSRQPQFLLPGIRASYLK